MQHQGREFLRRAVREQLLRRWLVWLLTFPASLNFCVAGARNRRVGHNDDVASRRMKRQRERESHAFIQSMLEIQPNNDFAVARIPSNILRFTDQLIAC